MSRRFYKFKLLLDEGFLSRKALPRLNSRYDIKHIASDLKYTGLPDPKVYEIAIEQKRILLTFNDKDFKNLASISKNCGVIGVSANLLSEQIDKKITSLLTKSKPGDLYGKFNYISGET